MLYGVIMAGGSGTRFWPLSRRSVPKQAMPFLGGESLFEMALARLAGLTPPERTFVVTTGAQAELLASQAADIPRENVVAEPVGRDSAAAIFLAAAIIAARDEDAVMIVKAADHIIKPIERFHAAALRAAEVAERGYLVTFGVVPSYPATGYGYVERGEPLEGIPGAYEVRRFREKPNLETAREYIADGNHYWNSGIFVWRARDILEAARRFAPKHHAAIAPLGALFGTPRFAAAMAAAYEGLEKISIDYAVMEHADNVATVEADFEWDDVGSLVSFKDYSETDENGNVVHGLAEALASSGCVLVSGDDHLLTVIGCDNLIVIHTDDATLVCPADRAQEVKRLVSKLEGRKDIGKYL